MAQPLVETQVSVDFAEGASEPKDGVLEFVGTAVRVGRHLGCIQELDEFLGSGLEGPRVAFGDRDVRGGGTLPLGHQRVLQAVGDQRRLPEFFLWRQGSEAFRNSGQDQTVVPRLDQLGLEAEVGALRNEDDRSRKPE
jgi:hypothetical protein